MTDDLVKYLRYPVGQRSTTQQAMLDAADEIERLRDALDEIAYSKHCQYEINGDSQYGIGVTDGHRFCARIARRALRIDIND